MTITSSSRTAAPLVVLHAIRIRGVASADVVCEMTGLAPSTVDAELRTIGERGWAVFRESRIASGWGLTPDGRAHHAVALREDVTTNGHRPALEPAYDGFVAQNDRLKMICTSWQTEGEPVSCVGDLTTLHAVIAPVLDELSATVARFAPYGSRLLTALRRFRRGDRSALARPLSGSYHDVWMELHEDLLLSLDRSRSAADGH